MGAIASLICRGLFEGTKRRDGGDHGQRLVRQRRRPFVGSIRRRLIIFELWLAANSHRRSDQSRSGGVSYLRS